MYRAVHPLIGKLVAIKVLARQFSRRPRDGVAVHRRGARGQPDPPSPHHRHLLVRPARRRPPLLRDGASRRRLARRVLDRDSGSGSSTRCRSSAAIGRALDAAHAKGIAHRDLKAENVIVGRDDDGAVCRSCSTSASRSCWARRRPQNTRRAPARRSARRTTCRRSSAAARRRSPHGPLRVRRARLPDAHRRVPVRRRRRDVDHDEAARGPSGASIDDRRRASAWYRRRDRVVDGEDPDGSSAVRTRRDSRPRASGGAGRHPDAAPTRDVQTGPEGRALARSRRTRDHAWPRREDADALAARPSSGAATIVPSRSRAWVLALAELPRSRSWPRCGSRTTGRRPRMSHRRRLWRHRSLRRWRPTTIDAAPSTNAFVIATIDGVPDGTEVSVTGVTVGVARAGSASAGQRAAGVDLQSRRLPAAVPRGHTGSRSAIRRHVEEESAAAPPSKRPGKDDILDPFGKDAMTRLAYLIALAACTDFSTIERGVCGNGIVEPGEDCDSNDPSCVRCAVVCSSASDCPTTDYACGADGLCHAPAGKLASPTAPVSFAADDIRITDLDHDGIGDLVGVSKTSLVVRFGDAAGGLARLDSIVTPAQTGPAAFGDLDGDGSIDVTVSARDGLVSYTSPFGAPSPVDIESPIFGSDGQPLDIASLFPIGSLQLGVFFVVDGRSSVAAVDFVERELAVHRVSVRDPTRRGHARAARHPLPRRLSRVGRGCRDHRRRGVVPDDHRRAVRDRDPWQLGRGLHAHRHHAAGPHRERDRSSPTSTSMPIRARASSTPTVGRPRSRSAGLMGTGHCTLAGRRRRSRFRRLRIRRGCGRDRSHASRAGARGLRERHARDERSVSMSPHRAAHTGPTPRRASSARRLRRYRSRRPYRPRAVRGRRRRSRRAVALPVLGLELLRLDTESDHDAHGRGLRRQRLDDIAYTERVGDTSGGRSRMARRSTAAAGPGRRSPSLVVRSSGFPTPTIRSTSSPTCGADRWWSDADDARPSWQPAADDAVVSRSPRELDAVAEELRGSVVGSFVPTMVAALTVPDLSAGDAEHQTVSSDARDGLRRQRVDARRHVLGRREADRPRRLPLAPMTTRLRRGGGCTSRGRASEGHDVVFAIDRGKSPTASVFDPNSSTATTIAATKARGLHRFPAVGTIQALHAADLDGDGSDELIAAFTPSDASAPGGVLVCHVDGTGQPHNAPTSWRPRSPLSATASVLRRRARARHRRRDRFSTGAPPRSDRRVSDSGTHAVSRDVAQRRLRGRGRARTHDEPVTSIQVGDVTGDGVDDLVALVGDSGAESLVVFAQCTSRDAASCAGESP